MSNNNNPYIYQAGIPPKQINSLNYTGTPLSTVPVVNVPRAPTVNDGQFPLFTLWRNANKDAVIPDAEGDLWYFARVNTAVYPVQYVWNKIATGTTPGGTMIGLTDTSLTPVLPNGSGFIQLLAGSGLTITSDAPNNRLIISMSGGGVGIDSIAVPAGTSPVVADGMGLITFNAGSGITITGGLNSMTFNTVGGIASSAFNVDANTAPGTDPVVPTVGGQVTVTGGQVAAGTVGTNVIRTNSLAANTYTIEIQRSSAVGSTSLTANGACHFNSAMFSVDGNGFVSLNGGGIALDALGVQATSGGGTNPVTPDGTGKIETEGALVAAGTNPVRTVSTAANTQQIQVQTSQALASTDATRVGLAAFDSAAFAVDANGFVTSLSAVVPFYAQGVFTPVLQFGGASVGITYFIQSGTYTRIGNTVTIGLTILLTNKGSSTGDATIAGLPFAESTGVNLFMFPENITFSGGYTIPTAVTAAGSTSIILNQKGSAASQTPFTNTNFANNSSINISGTYFV